MLHHACPMPMPHATCLSHHFHIRLYVSAFATWWPACSYPCSWFSSLSLFLRVTPSLPLSHLDFGEHASIALRSSCRILCCRRKIARRRRHYRRKDGASLELSSSNASSLPLAISLADKVGIRGLCGVRNGRGRVGAWTLCVESSALFEI